jgi:hypothetical protein
MEPTELFGIAASVVVAISLMMRNIKRLRLINGIGAAAFAGYGAAIGSLPVLVLNAFIVCIDLWYLWRMQATRDTFGSIEGDPADWVYFDLFLDFYRRDIEAFNPGYKPDKAGGWRAEFILRDMVPVALVVFRPAPNGAIEIGLDYAVPSHRDFKSAEFYFGKAAERIAKGQELVFVERTAVAAHQRYLERLGFVAQDRGDSETREYRKTVRA